MSTVRRAMALDGLLQDHSFPSMTLHPLPKAFAHKAKKGEELKADTGRIERLQAFKARPRR